MTRKNQGGGKSAAARKADKADPQVEDQEADLSAPNADAPPGTTKPVEAKMVTVAEALQKGEKTVLCDFPKAVNLTLPNKSRIAFPKGTNDVPESLVEPELHWYLKANGVTKRK